MAQYLVTIEYDNSTVYRTYQVEAESEDWIEQNLDYVETRGEFFDEDIEFGIPSILEIEEGE